MVCVCVEMELGLGCGVGVGCVLCCSMCAAELCGECGGRGHAHEIEREIECICVCLDLYDFVRRVRDPLLPLIRRERGGIYTRDTCAEFGSRNAQN